MRKFRQAILSIGLLLVIMVACTNRALPPTATATSDKPPATQEKEIPCLALPPRGEGASPYQLGENERFIDGQIIFTGLGEDVLTLTQELAQKDPDLRLTPGEPARRIQLGYLAKYEPREGYLIPFPAARVGELVIELYTISPGSLPRAMRESYHLSVELQKQGRIDAGVYADANYVTGDPWSVGGDPWSVGGDPSAPFTEAMGLFYQQWALIEEKGIGLYDASGKTRLIQAEGKGTNILVFDTSPFESPGGWRIPWVDPVLDLCVYHPELAQPVVSTSEKPDVADHGLFASGLAHAMAPQSRIHLIRVLNEHGEGDLFSLIESITLFTEKLLGAQGSLDRTVINLSLGIHPSLKPEDVGLTDEIIEQIRRETAPNPPLHPGLPGDPAAWDTVRPPILALETQLALAYSYGAVVAGASGNDSYEIAPGSPPLVTQIPASYPFILGVGANTNEQSRSCFSNAGELAAPGGEGIATSSSPCVPNLTACTSADCPYGVISLSLSSPTGYLYGAGTSFSTPLVSGLAALVFEVHGGGPENVMSKIEANLLPTPPDEHLGQGIIQPASTVP